VVEDDAMTAAVTSLLDEVLAVQPRGDGRFVSQPSPGAFDRLYGGQLLAQALLAAAQTVPAERLVNSMHAYYLRLGDPTSPIDYAVTNLRDSSSYSTRRVTVTQGERALAEVMISFHRGGVLMDHQQPMPSVAGPEDFLPRAEAIARDLGDAAPANAGKGWPVEVRYGGREPWNQNPGEPRNILWMRIPGTLPDQPLVQAAALAYSSDLVMFEVVISPSEISWVDLVQGRGVFGSSLDHTIWFHRPFRADDWLLMTQESVAAAGSRGVATGRFYNRDGLLVASVAQEIGLTVADARRG
jgi:acyl-CoA thioesterase-2